MLRGKKKKKYIISIPRPHKDVGDMAASQDDGLK
jgi:hypothetical protein